MVVFAVGFAAPFLDFSTVKKLQFSDSDLFETNVDFLFYSSNDFDRLFLKN